MIATFGSLSPALEMPLGRCNVVAGSATLGQRQRCPRMPVFDEFLLLLLFLAKQILKIRINKV